MRYKGGNYMNKFLIATHGRLAEGYKSALGLFGKDEAVETVCAYVDDADYTQQIQDFIDGVGEEDQAVIFTDILGGSVNQKVVLLVNETRATKSNIQILTNVNFPTMLAVLLESRELTPEVMTTLLADNNTKPTLLDFEGLGVAHGEEDFFGED
jgi:PTS system mannose-specific IIA component